MLLPLVLLLNISDWLNIALQTAKDGNRAVQYSTVQSSDHSLIPIPAMFCYIYQWQLVVEQFTRQQHCTALHFYDVQLRSLSSTFPNEISPIFHFPGFRNNFNLPESTPNSLILWLRAMYSVFRPTLVTNCAFSESSFVSEHHNPEQ